MKQIALRDSLEQLRDDEQMFLEVEEVDELVTYQSINQSIIKYRSWILRE